MLLIVIVAFLFSNCTRDLEPIIGNDLSDDVNNTPVENASPKMLVDLAQEIKIAEMEFESYSGVETERCEAREDLIAKIHSIKPLKEGLELAYEDSEDDTELAVAVADAIDLMEEYDEEYENDLIVVVCNDVEEGGSSSSQIESSSAEAESSDDGKEVKWLLTLKADDNGTVVNYQEKVVEGESFQIEATPKSKYEFDTWVVTSGDVTIANADNATTTIQLESDVTLTATFKEKEDGNPDPDPVPEHKVKIEFEKYTSASTLKNISKENNFPAIGHVEGGENLVFGPIEFEEGTYTISIKYATWNSNKKQLNIKLDGSKVGEWVSTDMTGTGGQDYNSYTEKQNGEITVAADGTYELEIAIKDPNINLDWIEFSPK